MAKRDADVPRSPAAEYTFDFSGGRLCLDFVNTVSESRAAPKERLNSYLDLVSWGRQANVLDDSDARHLTQLAKRRPEDASRTLESARRLREAMFRIFCVAGDCGHQRPEDMEILNAALSRALSHVRLDATAEGCLRVWGDEVDAMDRMLWPVLRSAMDVLTSSEDRARIHKCESPRCDWLFMDTSRNHSRRWCDMKSCGNRAKAHRYYERHKSQ
jgi:predicted RNA-binding Zn ribbon-like protein